MTALFENAIPLAALYGLIAVGYVVIYRASGVLNFAHGGLMVLGAFIGFALAGIGIVGIVVFPLVILAGAAIGGLFYRLAMRPMAGQPVWAAVLVTIGFGFFVVIGIVQMIWSPRIRDFSGDLGFANGNHEVLGLRFSTIELVLIASFVVVEAALLAFYRWSRSGIRMRAASQDHHLSAYRGINIDIVFALAWGIATGLVMYVGFAYSVDARLDMGAIGALALKAFPAALAGGMDSVGGVVAGALVIAFAEVYVQLEVDPLLAEAVPYLALLLVLIVRPWGLFGTPEAVDRV
ncbi:MAG TPA: branched-chain amino acid ABC transporter permease [Solirubrobacteraceae bacterium]|nr:branched-chain amino acid ABC transporter permease [Solirubrobacteraceae bacterium]